MVRGMTDPEIAELLTAQNKALRRIAVSLEALVVLGGRATCALEAAPDLVAKPIGPLPALRLVKR